MGLLAGSERLRILGSLEWNTDKKIPTMFSLEFPYQPIIIPEPHMIETIDQLCRCRHQTHDKPASKGPTLCHHKPDDDRIIEQVVITTHLSVKGAGIEHAPTASIGATSL